MLHAGQAFVGFEIKDAATTAGLSVQPGFDRLLAEGRLEDRDADVCVWPGVEESKTGYVDTSEISQVRLLRSSNSIALKMRKNKKAGVIKGNQPKYNELGK